MEEIIKQEIKRIIREVMRTGIETYPSIGGAKEFPYNDGSGFVALPEDMNPTDDYLINWEGVSENKDLYGFPLEEFKKGIHVEKAKRDLFNMLDIGEIVIKNLKSNHQFYSNLGV